MGHFRRALIGILVLLVFTAANLGAATIKVYPSMTRAQIQAAIDGAADNTTIRFTAGTYDFSDTPFSSWPWIEGGALRVVEKSLKFVADKRTTLLGADSTLDPETGYGTSGIIAFNVVNSADKDVSFKGFIFSKFAIGIGAGKQSGGLFQACCRNFTIQNCVFLSIHRNAVALTGVAGNINIIGNTIVQSLRIGLFIDWYWVGDNTQTQPVTGSLKIQNNSISVKNAVAPPSLSLSCALISRGYNLSVINNNFDAAGCTASSYGISIGGGAYQPKIVNNDFTNVDYGLAIEGDTSELGTFPLMGAMVANNRITAYSGIWAGNGTCRKNTYMNNKIHVSGSGAAAFGVYGCYDDTIISNKISGNGIYAFDIEGYDKTASGGPKADSYNEILKNNSVKNFVPEEGGAHYLCNKYTHDNVVNGICRENATYFDEGLNNVFRCLTPMSAASGGCPDRFSRIIAAQAFRTPLEK